jgi:hypothetical protein
LHGFTQPSAIQVKGINSINTGKDCILQSQSGTGKTATYLLGVMNRLVEEEKWFDHEALLALINGLRQDATYSIKFVGSEYCVWPGHENDSTIILMGLSDAESKKSKLREMGFNEEQIQWQSPGVK